MRPPKRFCAAEDRAGNALRRTLFRGALLAVAVFLFKGVLGASFLYDDDTFIVSNKNIETLSPASKCLSTQVTSNNPQRTGTCGVP